MKLFYNNQDGKIFYAVKNNDLFWFTHSANIPLNEFGIDEIDPVNKALCIDLVRTVNKIDNVGDNKYKIEAGQLIEKEGWIAYTPNYDL